MAQILGLREFEEIKPDADGLINFFIYSALYIVNLPIKYKNA